MHNLTLQEKIYNFLNAIPSISTFIGEPKRIYDILPSNTTLPVIIIGEVRSKPMVGYDNAFENIFNIYVYSKYAGQKEIKNIFDLVNRNIKSLYNDQSELKICNIRILFTDILKLTDNQNLQGILKIRIVTESE